jgi:hypothetical protein
MQPNYLIDYDLPISRTQSHNFLILYKCNEDSIREKVQIIGGKLGVVVIRASIDHMVVRDSGGIDRLVYRDKE